jgi:hypothetical protein
MEVELISVSPISFMMAKEGDILEIRRKLPKLNEYRGTLEVATESLLIFKGQTKIGMIPYEVYTLLKNIKFKKKCRISMMNKEMKKIQIKIFITDIENNKI